MTVRSISFAWFVALMFNLVAFAILWNVPPANHQTDFNSDTRIVVIGSSLTRHAFPQEPPADGIFGDGRAHVRWSINAITARQSFDLLDRALALGAETVFVEANPLVFDFAPFSEPRSHLFVDRISDVQGVVHTQTATIRDHWRAALGRQAENWIKTNQDSLSDHALNEEPDDLQKWYPITFKSAYQSRKLSRYVQRANAQGTEIVFFEPPRSVMLMSGLSGDEISEIRRRTSDLGGIGLAKTILFDSIWPNEMFQDIGSHLNRSGRNRFLTVLSARYEALR